MIERSAAWLTLLLTPLRIAVGLGLLFALVAQINPALLIETGSALSTTKPRLVLVPTALGLSALSGQLLHFAHWFGPGKATATGKPLFYRMHPAARPFIFILLVVGSSFPVGCFYLAVFFARRV